MTQAQLTRMGIGLAICYGIYKFAPKEQLKAAALGVAGVIVARQVPFLNESLAG